MSTGDYFGMPTALISNDGDTLVTDPEMIKSVTKDYWSKLYKQQDTPNVPKPWLSTPSVVELKQNLFNGLSPPTSPISELCLDEATIDRRLQYFTLPHGS